MNKNRSHIQGFTLIELAIVIVIIGLITGGIIGGRSMITAASRQGVVKEMNTVMTAVRNFQADFGKLPGLLYNSDRYFDVSAIGCNALTSYNSGNRVLLLGMRGKLAFTSLYCAGYLEYTNRYRTSRGYYLSDFTPQYGKFSTNAQNNLKWKMAMNITRSRNAVMLGGSTGGLRKNVISPVEAKWFDEKVDDGNPVRGNFVQVPDNAGAGDCYTAASQTYNLTVQESTCNYDFLID